MIETFRGIWRFAGEEQRNIRRSVIACFFNAVFHMFEIAAIYYTILALLDGKTGPATAWQALGLLAVSILGSAVTRYFSQLEQTHAGYFMAANKRVAIGQRMKSVPMGYFNDNSLGELTGVCTTVLDNVETVAPMVLVTMLGGTGGSVSLWWRPQQFICSSPRPWSKNPPPSPRTVRSPRPSWWRRCWSMCRA